MMKLKLTRAVSKSALIGLLAVVLLTGCAGHNSAACFQVVMDAYPDSKVKVLPGFKFRFLVKRPNGDIIFVKTMNNTNTDITSAEVLFEGS